MKRIFYLLLLLIPYLVKSQPGLPTQKVVLTDVKTEAIIKNTISIEGAINPPRRDTTFTPDRAGQIVIKPSNNKAYISTGATDGSAKWAEINTSVVSSIAWGNLTGNITNQIDLINLLAGKQNNITLGLTSQYFDGTLALRTFPTIPAQLNPGVSGLFSVTGTYPNLFFNNLLNNTNQLTNGAGFLTANQNITLTGDVTAGPNGTNLSTTLASIITGGSCTNCNITYDAKGRITVAANGSGSGVASVFTRTGNIVAVSGDYTAAQVTNAISSLGSYSDPTWITSLAYGKLTGTPSLNFIPLSFGSSDQTVNANLKTINFSNLQSMWAAAISTSVLTSGDSVRWRFNIPRMAFKAGRGTNFQLDSLPWYSFQYGIDNYIFPTVQQSSSIGTKDSIWAYRSVAIGLNNRIGLPGNPNGTDKSFAIGEFNSISGSFGYAFGLNNTVAGSGYALGTLNQVSGANGFALGFQNTTTGSNATTWGYNNLAAGDYSTSFGYFSTARGLASIAGGVSVVASKPFQTWFGRYNDTTADNGTVALGLGWGFNNPSVVRTNLWYIDSFATQFLKPGNTATRPVSPVAGMFRFNSDSSGFEQYTGAAWLKFGGSSGGAGSTNWGLINGTLSSQIDLMDSLSIRLYIKDSVNGYATPTRLLQYLKKSFTQNETIAGNGFNLNFNTTGTGQWSSLNFNALNDGTLISGNGSNVYTQGPVYLLGTNDTLTASYSLAVGQRNKSLVGPSNVVPNYLGMIGKDNLIRSLSTATNGGLNFIFGDSSNSTAQNTFTTGHSLANKYSYQSLFGKWNDSTRPWAWGIGYGTSNVNRFNIAGIDSLGTMFLKPGNTAQRPPGPIAGMFRYNSDSLGFEQFNGSIWTKFGTGSGTGGGTLTNVGITPFSGITASAPVTGTGGNITLSTSLNGILRGTGSGFTTAAILPPLSFSGGALSADTLKGLNSLATWYQITHLGSDTFFFVNQGLTGNRMVFARNDSVFISKLVDGDGIDVVKNTDSSNSLNNLHTYSMSLVKVGNNTTLINDLTTLTPFDIYMSNGSSVRGWNDYTTIPAFTSTLPGLGSALAYRKIFDSTIHVVNDPYWIANTNLHGLLWASTGLDSLETKLLGFIGPGVSDSSDGHRLLWYLRNLPLTFTAAQTVATGGFNYLVTGLPNKATLLGTDSVNITDVSGKQWKVPSSAVSGNALTDGDKGDITVATSGSVWTIDNDAVTNAKMANMVNARIKARITAGTGDPEDATGTQITALLDLATSAAKGLAPATGTPANKFLRDDMTWQTPSASGDLQTVLTAGSTLTGNNTVINGNNTLTWSGGKYIFTGNATGTPTAIGSRLIIDPATWTDNNTSASGTLTSVAFMGLGSPTFAATNTGVTYTDAYALYVNGAPGAGTNVTLTNSYAFGASGLSFFSGSVGISARPTTAANLFIGGPTTSRASLNWLSTATDVATPNTGDMWRNADHLYFRTSASTVDIAAGAGGLPTINPGEILGNNTTSAATAAAVKGDIELISEQTVTTASSTDISFANYYNVYYRLELEIYDYHPTTTTTDLMMRFTADNSTYPTTGYKFSINGAFSDVTSITTAGNYTSSSTTGGATNPNTTAVVLMNGVGNQTTNNNRATLFFEGLDGTAQNPEVNGTVSYKTNGGNGATRTVWGEYSTNQATQGVRLLPSGGGTFSFKYRLWGRKK